MINAAANAYGRIRCIARLGDLAGHDGDICISVTCVFDDTPAEARKESLSTRSEKIKCGKAASRCLAENVLGECATDTALPLRWSDKNPGKPRRVLWPNIHLMVHERRGAE